MSTSVSVRAVSLLIALASTFVLGGAGGYVVRGMTTPAAVVVHAGTLCPAGRHVVVWYTAHTWGCEAQALG